VVKYLCKQTVWTPQWHGGKDLTTRVGSFALHIIFCLGLGGGGQLPVPARVKPFVIFDILEL